MDRAWGPMSHKAPRAAPFGIAEGVAGLEDRGVHAHVTGVPGMLLLDVGQPLSPATPSAMPNGAARGALWDIGPHALPILLPALGPVPHVVADHGLGDTVTVVLRHESGAASTMSLSLTAPPGSRGSTWQLFGQDHQTSMPA